MLTLLVWSQHYFSLSCQYVCTYNVIYTSSQSDVLFQWLIQLIQDPGLLFTSVIIFTDGRAPWMSDQLVARPRPKHRTTQTQNKHIHTPNIHAFCRIRTHDDSNPTSERAKALYPLTRSATETGSQSEASEVTGGNYEYMYISWEKVYSGPVKMSWRQSNNSKNERLSLT
jgi:hypothetical protein